MPSNGDAGSNAGVNQTTLDEEFVVPEDALMQRHRWFHDPSCEDIPRMSERVSKRETYMRALKPCPNCSPSRGEPA